MGLVVSSWLLVEAGGEALEAAGSEVVSVTVERSLSGLHLLRVDLLVGGGVGGGGFSICAWCCRAVLLGVRIR